MCSEAEAADCLEEFGDGQNLEWACANCEKARGDLIHPYTWWLLKLHKLRLAGYPLRANDLSLEQWLDLGRMTEWATPRL